MMIGMMIVMSVVPDDVNVVVLDVVVLDVVNVVLVMTRTMSSHTCGQIVSTLEGRNVLSSFWSTGTTTLTTMTTTTSTTVVERIRPHVEDTVDGSSFDDDDQDFEASSRVCGCVDGCVDGNVDQLKVAGEGEIEKESR